MELNEEHKYEILLEKNFHISLVILLITNIGVIYKFNTEWKLLLILLGINVIVLSIFISTKRPFKYVINFKENKMHIYRKSLVSRHIQEEVHDLSSLSFSLKTEAALRASNNKNEVLTIYTEGKLIEQIVLGLRGWNKNSFDQMVNGLIACNVRRVQ